MAAVRFTATIDIRGINPFVPVSAARAEKIQSGWRKAMPVKVRINGEPQEAWRINMMPAGQGAFYLYLHESVRTASGTGVGDKVKVEVEFDGDYRGGPAPQMPLPLAKALKARPAAMKQYKALSPSRQKELVRHFARLKTEAAIERNLAMALRVLEGHPGRFMARDWN
jgi:hypothetical protein